MAKKTMSSAKNLARLLVLVQVAASLLAGPGGSVAALSFDYYSMTCPFAEMMVRSVVYDALMKDPTLAGSLLRLHFHDCFVQGCDASVLIDSADGNTAEKDAQANLTLRGFEVIDRIKELLESQCPGVVSCADILALAARDAVLLARGPYYGVPTAVREGVRGVRRNRAPKSPGPPNVASNFSGTALGVPLGRRDGTRSVDSDTFTALPPPFFNATMLMKLFGSHGFTVQDMVALSGGHTLGVAHCANFKGRLAETDTLDAALGSSLGAICTANGDAGKAPFDRTSTSFDTVYFRELQMRRGLLSSDQTLFESPETRGIVNMFAMNQAYFFYAFQQGMLKMGQLDLKEGDDGEIRHTCRVINS